MKKFKMGFILLFIMIILIGVNTVKVKALTGVETGTLDELFNSKIKAGYDNVNYISSAESAPDYLGFFTGERSGWKPRIKYIGTDKNNILMYVFCLSFHKTAPNNISYQLDNTDFSKDSIAEKYYAYAYIIQHGFGWRGYSESNYNDLLWDYYITSMAIYQYQYETDPNEKTLMAAAHYEDIRDNDNFKKESAPYNAIMNLVDQAKNKNNWGKEFVAPYKPSNDQYQEITLNLVYKVYESTPETHTCEKVDDTYYDKDGNTVSKEDYEESCLPSPTCAYKNGKYYDDDGNEVTQSEYKEICETTIEPKIKITYKDKCTNEHVGNAKMKLVKGANCSGTVVKSWTSGTVKTFNDIEAGSYMICDTTNNYSKSISVKRISSLQEFEMYTNPDTCEEPAANEEKPPTGVASATLIGLVLAITVGGYIYLKKHDKFIKMK